MKILQQMNNGSSGCHIMDCGDLENVKVLSFQMWQHLFGWGIFDTTALLLIRFETQKTIGYVC